MTIRISGDEGIEYPERYETIITDIIEYAVDFVGCPYECDVEVTLTDNERIKEINHSERGIDSPTDVLSFPMIDFEKPTDLSLAEAHPEDYFHPETGELLLGDIVISIERAAEQAKEYNHSIFREIAFLTAHSMLHLFGYDHMTDEERVEMEKLQDQILNDKGYTRDYE